MNRFLKRPEPLLIDRQTVAGLLNCSLRHVIKLESDGKLKPIRLGTAVRHSRAFIDSFIGVEELRPPGCTDDLSFLL